MASTTLPGITRIDFLPARLLPKGVMGQSMAGHPVVVAAPSTRIPLVGIPQMQWSSAPDHERRVEEVALEFTTTAQLPEDEPLGFVVGTPSGVQYLIGTNDRRHPVVKWEQTTGTPSKDAAARAYKVTMSGLKVVHRCIL